MNFTRALIIHFLLCTAAHAAEEFNLFKEFSPVQDEQQQQQKQEINEPKDAHGEPYPLTWGEFDSGKGMLIGRNEKASMTISFYVLGRYINQQPPTQDYTDHLGRTTLVDTRNDIELHRILVWLKGFAYDPKFFYNINFWTVNATKGIHIVGNLVYKFDPKFEFEVGVEGLPGARSLNGQHPYFLGTDRHLGDEFFKPGFSMGAHIRGQLSKNVFYRTSVQNAMSEIGISTAQFTRNMAYGATVWVLPTGEFGPRGGYGDYEMHESLSSRFGISVAQSREDAFAQADENDEPKNTSIRLSDGLNLFSPDALGNGLTVKRANYTIISPDFAFKYRGFFFDFNYYYRLLSGFKMIDGKAPQKEIRDNGFMTQVAHQIVPQKWELYSAYTYIWGEFNNPWEIALGANYYPQKTRNFRLNMMVNHVEQSPVNSQFGYYVGGQTGETLVLASDVFF